MHAPFSVHSPTHEAQKALGLLSHPLSDILMMTMAIFFPNHFKVSICNHKHKDDVEPSCHFIAR